MGWIQERHTGANDRISALPDALLSHILCFLPTKYAVRTTILSKRYNKMWASLPSLHFDDDDHSDLIAFEKFVDRLFYFRDSVDVRKLFLSFYFEEFELPRVEGWICTALKRNVVEFDLCIDTDADNAFELPRSLFICKTLQSLKLRSKFITNPPTSMCFPSLKVLYVLVDHPSDGSLQKLLSYFPALESLTIEGCLEDEDEEDMDINVLAPELRTLEIILEINNADNHYEFCIDAPKLECLDLYLNSGNSLSNCYFVINGNSLVKANIDLQFDEQSDDESAPEDQISNMDLHHAEQAEWLNLSIKILENISNVKCLSLSAYNLEGDLPAFGNLNQLKLDFIDCCYLGFLTKLLERSPNLEYLVFEHGECTTCEEKDFRHDEFHPLESVPTCLLTHLKTITVNRFKGRRHEMEMAKYMLKNGKVLNKMTLSTVGTISGLSFAYLKALFDDLMLFQKGSKTCQIEML